MTHSRHDKMTNAAVWLASHGAFVGWGAASDGKAVNRRWKSDMTTDPALIPNLLAGARNSVIVPAGRLLVVDVDKAGWYERLKAQGLPETFTVMSPTVRQMNGDPAHTYRGVHVYLQTPVGFDVTTIPGVFGGGETRRSVSGDQSMVLGPYSMRTDGIYEPVPGTPRLIAEAPMTVLDFLIAHGAKGAETAPLITISRTDDGDWTWDESMGSRHDHLRDKIRKWHGNGLDTDALIAAVNSYVDRHAIPLGRGPGEKPIDLGEIGRMIRGAQKKYSEDRPEGPISVSVPAGNPSGTEDGQTESGDPVTVVIDPLAIESRIDRPEPFDIEAVSLPSGLYGLVEHFRPLTDAPFSSLLLTSCVVMSALVGTNPSLHWRGRHRAALFGVLVGHSGYGRKGATMREVETAFRQVDPLLDDIQVSGIGSGEVLVDILNESKTNTIGTSLIWEHEIANVLILASREGNIMSGNLRRAWDGDAVQSRSRAKGKSSATGYNVAFMGGVTPNELARRLSADDIANGWANRFLWFHSERRDGGFDETADTAMNPSLLDWLRSCVEHARLLGGAFLIKPQYTMTLSPDALSRMNAVSIALDVPPLGAIGALRQRMPAHTIRLAMVAALFDKTSEVSLDHVLFGEAMTGYAVESMRPVFGLRVDDPVAMNILDLLAQTPDGWLNTSTIGKALAKSGDRVNRGLRLLLEAGLVVREDRKTAGRPAIGYRLKGL